MKPSALTLLLCCLVHWSVRADDRRLAEQVAQPGFRQPGFGSQPFARPGFQAGFGPQFGLLGYGGQPSLGQQTGTGSFPTSFAPQPQFPFFAYDYGMCILDPRGSGFNVRGVVRLRQLRAGGPFGRFNRPLEMMVNVTGLTPGQNHGFHAHTWGDMSNGCASAAAIYNPFRVQHGGPNDVPFPAPGRKTRMVGDFGNLQADQFGQANTMVLDRTSSLSSGSLVDILGRSLVVFERPDDLGLAGTPSSLTTGNTGNRMACCVVGRADASSWPGNQAFFPQPGQTGQPGQGQQFNAFGRFPNFFPGQANSFSNQPFSFSGQPVSFLGQPFFFQGQPFPGTNTNTNPNQGTQPNQPTQPGTTQFNPSNPSPSFNPSSGQFSIGANPTNPFAANVFAGANPAFNPFNANPSGTFGFNSQQSRFQTGQSASTKKGK